jgi:cell division protein FtsZ
MIAFEDDIKQPAVTSSARIKVIGVGGAGNNTINSMIRKEYDTNIEFIAANTDAQTLGTSLAKTKIQLGVKLTKGLGSGANPEIGRRAAEEDLDKILEVVADADIVFLAAGMGGGTGSGALPVIARALRERGILTIAVITKPFMFEGKRRAKIAEAAIRSLQECVDTQLVIPNQKLLDLIGENIPMVEAFELINDILYQSVRGISYIMVKSGHINVDFADLRTIMKDMGRAVMGTGRAVGQHRAAEATRAAISSPLLENININGARGILLNISGGPTLGLHEIHEAAAVIYEQADDDANIILGSVIDPSMSEEVIVTVIATGCQSCEQKAVAANQSLSDKSLSDKSLDDKSSTDHVSPDQVSLNPVPLNQVPLSQVVATPFYSHDRAIQPGVRANDTQSSATQSGDTQSSATQSSGNGAENREFVGQSAEPTIDINDIDVPTFLRDRAAENSKL